MKQSGYLYNNEAIASIAIGYFLKKHGATSIAKSLLILPFILHEPTLKKLRGSSFKRSLEEFILKHPECLNNFNNRYLDFLPLSINSITLLYEIGVIKIERDKIIYNYSVSFAPEKSNTIGLRAAKMFSAIDVLHELMQNQDTNSFYLKLKIVL